MPVGDDGPPSGPDPVLVSAAAMVFVDDPAAPVLDVADAHHVLDVLRLRPGEVVITSDGAGSWVPCRIGPTVSDGRSTRVRDLGSVLVPDGPVVTDPPGRPALTVAFAPVKGDRPEWVVQKLTELGVDRIVPLRTNRSVVRWEGQRADRAVDRLRMVAREASAQCRRTRLPVVTQVSSLEALAAMGAADGTAPSLAHPGGTRPTLARPVIAVGPEGGWDEAELAGADSVVGLGSTVLRAETAAVVAGAVLAGLRSGLVGSLA